ncbi:FkbM family methyltransferase [Paenibacillus sp. sgz5001063]|uniref:FkbM family methyltransferase n=1 Tax=Paenibacillus sp. sgz5001063 TaxID=3242474 RepID=UPI0036D3D7BB
MLNITNRKTTIIEEKRELFLRVLQSDEQKFIVGINPLCDHLIDIFNQENIYISGIVDDFTDKSDYMGYPIFKTQSLPKDALAISCVVDGKLITAIDNLKSHGINNILTYLELRLQSPDLFKQVRFCENNIIDIEINENKYNWLYSILEDELSQKTLENILDFRYNYNVESMRFFPFQLHNQYFDDFIPFSDNEIFVDCGGFDGSTTISFISKHPSYKNVYYFEPSPSQFIISKKNLGNYRDITLFNLATHNCNTILKFDSGVGSSSSISNSGNIEIKTTKLDDVINDAVTYIKLDVEGVEFETLQGAENLIKKFQPKLAVCVYHNQADFWRIPELVLSYNPSYKVYIRHYTEGLLETVMYFI